MVPSSVTTLSLVTEPGALERLQRLIKALRQSGVVQFALGELTLSILPDEPLALPAPMTEARESTEGVDGPQPRRKDGLTPEEQAELYGRQMS